MSELWNCSQSSEKWKTIAIPLVDRCWKHMKTHIPPSQAAYQKDQKLKKC